MKIKKPYKIILTTFVLLAILFSGLYLLTINGEAYKYSVRYIEENKRLEDIIGTINKQHLSYLGPYFVSTNGKDGCANFSIFVEGRREKGKVHLSLKRQNGNWEVTEATLTFQEDKVVSIN